MKRLMCLLMLTLSGILLYSQNQPVILSSSTSEKRIVDPSQDQSENVLLDPSGLLVWSQAPACVGLASSEVISSQGLESNCADDFMLTEDASITGIKWWFGWWNGTDYSPLTVWTITIYDDNACLPGNIVFQVTVPWEFSNELLYCYNGSGGETYEYWCEFSPAFEALANTRYWISIQAGDHAFPPQWGWDRIQPISECPGAFKSAFFGFPNYIPGINVFGDDYDFAFELYSLPCGDISLVGEFNGWGDWGDHWMDPDPFNPGLWTTTIVLTNDMDLHGDPAIIEMKFRENGNWLVNWGSDAFPTGFGCQNGPNIPVPIRLYATEDTYLVTFNCITGEYTFVRAPEIPISNWAIALGVLLIIVFAGIRYRRLI
jgi:hypothetical protein